MKVTRELKSKITKLFKSGKSIDEIMTIASKDYSKITPIHINTIVHRHLYDRADELWSIAVRKVGKCELTGKTWNLQAHHLIKRDHLAFRWELQNGICLCSDAHDNTHEDSAWFEGYLKLKKPHQYNWLQTNKDCKPVFQVDNEYLLKVCKYLEKKVR